MDVDVWKIDLEDKLFAELDEIFTTWRSFRALQVFFWVRGRRVTRSAADSRQCTAGVGDS